MWKSLRSRIAPLLFGGMLLAATAPASAETVIRYIPSADLQVMDPILSTANIVRTHAYMIYDTLYGLDENFVPQPQMVDTSTVSADGKTYRFALRPGLKWHDGQPVTAEDCVASLKRWSARDAGGQIMGRVLKEMRVIDGSTFELEFNQPFPLVYELLAKVAANVPFMMPKRVAETDPAKEITDYVGSGPFRFVKSEWVPGSKVVYEKFADYVPRKEPPSGFAGGKTPKVDRVEWIITRDQQTALSALLGNEVDYWESPSMDLLPVLKSAGNVAVRMANKTGIQGGIFINHLQPPFNNQKARQALFWLTDQTAYLQAINGNPEFYQVCVSFFTCGTPMETSAGLDALAKPDAAKAKQLFVDAGWDFSKPIVILDPTDEAIAHPIAVVAAQALRDIGLKVDLQAMDWATVLKRRTSKDAVENGGWNLLPSYAGGVPLSAPIWSIVFTAACEKGALPGWPCNQTLEDLRTKWAFATSLDERKAIAEAYSREAAEFGHRVPLGQWKSYVALNSKITGVVDAQDVTVFWNLEKTN